MTNASDRGALLYNEISPTLPQVLSRINSEPTTLLSIVAMKPRQCRIPPKEYLDFRSSIMLALTRDECQ